MMIENWDKTNKEKSKYEQILMIKKLDWIKKIKKWVQMIVNESWYILHKYLYFNMYGSTNGDVNTRTGLAIRISKYLATVLPESW